MSKVFTEVISFKVCEEQRLWMENKAIEMTRRLGREVTMTMIMRALIQRQMDDEREMEKVWNEEAPIPSSVRPTRHRAGSGQRSAKAS